MRLQTKSLPLGWLQQRSELLGTPRQVRRQPIERIQTGLRAVRSPDLKILIQSFSPCQFHPHASRIRRRFQLRGIVHWLGGNTRLLHTRVGDPRLPENAFASPQRPPELALLHPSCEAASKIQCCKN